MKTFRANKIFLQILKTKQGVTNKQLFVLLCSLSIVAADDLALIHQAISRRSAYWEPIAHTFIELKSNDRM